MDHLQNINEILQKPWDAPSYAVWFSLTKTKTKMVKNEKITNSLTKTKTKTKNKSKRKSHCSYGLVSGKVDDIISCDYWHATRPLVDGCVIWLIQWHNRRSEFWGPHGAYNGVIGQRGPRDSPWSGIRGKAPWSWTFFAFAILHNLAGLLICRRNYFLHNKNVVWRLGGVLDPTVDPVCIQEMPEKTHPAVSYFSMYCLSYPSVCVTPAIVCLHRRRNKTRQFCLVCVGHNRDTCTAPYYEMHPLLKRSDMHGSW